MYICYRFEQASVMSMFAKSLSKSQTLEEFNLSSNPINSESSFLLLSNILPQAKLQRLVLNNIWVTQEFNKVCEHKDVYKRQLIRIAKCIIPSNSGIFRE